MSRSEIFEDRRIVNKMPKNLRYGAREAADYLTGRDPEDLKPDYAISNRPGRGASGESST
jgi:hypothetical protein